MSRPTLSDLVWPMDDESRRHAEEWAAGVSVQVLDWTWRAFDVLHANVLRRIDMSQPLARLAFYLIEPRSDDGLVDWNILDEAIGESKIYPIVRSRH